MKHLLYLLLITVLLSCNTTSTKKVPVIGFLDFVQDETLAQAKDGFYAALKDKGYSEDQKTISIIYRNAQGDQPTLVQSTDYFLSKKVDLIAANTTLSTITAVQRTHEIPVCMMVAPRPDLAKLTDVKGKAPANLFGVYETLDYIDTSLALVRGLLPSAKKIGIIYNQSEPQSVDALKRLEKVATDLHLELVSLPANNSNDTQILTESVVSKGIDAFFALPDNVVFASFETIAKVCAAHKIPVFTSESGLVKRGALAAYGADMYQWGYQAGVQAAEFLKTHKMPASEEVKVRKRVYNATVAKGFAIFPDTSFTSL